MLNEILYNKLCEVFGDVRIHNEDEQVELSALPATSAMELAGGGRSAGTITTAMVQEGGEHYAVCCPFCGDTRYRLWFCHAWGADTEINGAPVSFSKGLVHCYNEQCMKNTDNWVHVVRLLDSVDGLSRVDTEAVVAGPPPVIGMPENALDLRDRRTPRHVRDYLSRERGFDLDELAEHWGVCCARIPFYDSPAIIIPVWQRGELLFWQARYPGKVVAECFSDGARKPKYYIPSSAKKGWVLYNLDNVVGSPTAVLVEGVFDCIRIGYGGLAMFGTKPSAAQEKQLYSCFRGGRVIWIPDNNDPKSLEAAESGVAQWNERRLFLNGAHMLRLPGEGLDPAEHTREEIWALIRQLTG